MRYNTLVAWIGAAALSLSAFSVGGRQTEYIASSIFGAWLFFELKKRTVDAILYVSIALLSINLILSAENFLNDSSFSWFQILRTSIWSTVTIAFLPALRYVRQRHDLLEVIGLSGKILAVFLVITVATKLSLAPLAIDLKGDGGQGRYFLIFSILAVPLLWIGIIRHDMSLAVSCLAVIAFTQSKSLIAAVVVVLLFTARLTARSSILLCAALLLVVTLIDSSRVTDFVELGDSTRVEQISDGLSYIRESWLTLMFGAGEGVAYTEGYLRYLGSSDSVDRYVTNSRYDVESLFGHITLRYGMLGAVGVLILIWNVTTKLKSKAMILLITATIGMGTSILQTPVALPFFYLLALAAKENER